MRHFFLSGWLPSLAAVFVSAGVGRMSLAADNPRPNLLLCIADDWSWPHAGAYGDRVVKTPAFDRVAREGVLFTRAFCAAPSCTPSRAAILTGQMPHRLEAGGNLWGFLPARFPVYPDLLEASGYIVGMQGKGWSPGKVVGRRRNPAGPPAKSFEQFLASVPAGKPFCFWFGSTNPHRPYDLGSGAASGLNAADVAVPIYLPDTAEVRNDLLDYYGKVERFDRQVGGILALLERTGKLEATMVVVTSDNGMPFPRCKANLYDSGTHVPLAVRWGAGGKGGRRVDAFVSLADLCPTFLQAADLRPTPEMTGRSLLGLVADATPAAGRDRVFVERERHANVREGDGSYPSRALRTEKFMYIRNLRADRWPAGDPQLWKAVGPFGDIDPGPTKALILSKRDDPIIAPLFELACAKRPAEELYDLAKDPHQVRNIAADPAYGADLRSLRRDMDEWMTRTADPRAKGGDDPDAFDHYPYFGGAARNEMESRPRAAQSGELSR